MKVIGKDRTSCDVCNPIDEILARLDALERRASAIVAKVQGIAPDGDGNVTLPTSSSDTDPLHGRVDAFAMSSEVKEAADDAHAYAASIADDVVVLQSDVDILTREIEALDSARVTPLEQSVAELQTADGQNVKIDRINEYAVGLTGNQNISGVKSFLSEFRRIVTSNYARGSLSLLSDWSIGETVSENKAYWPVIVSNSDNTEYPFLIAITELVGGIDQITIKAKGQNNVTFGFTINCGATAANITLDAFGKSVVIGSITSD